MKFGQNLLEILSKYTTFTVLPSSQIRAHSKRPSSRSGEQIFIKKFSLIGTVNTYLIKLKQTKYVQMWPTYKQKLLAALCLFHTKGSNSRVGHPISINFFFVDRYCKYLLFDVSLTSLTFKCPEISSKNRKALIGPQLGRGRSKITHLRT